MIFLDLDETLIKTYYEDNKPQGVDCALYSKIKDSARKFKLVSLEKKVGPKRKFIIIPRPQIHWFLKEASHISDLFILTSAYQGYANDIVDAIDIRQYIKDVYSTYNFHKRFNIPLSDNWLLVDNSPWASCWLKFDKLGFPLSGLTYNISKFIENHYIQIKSWIPQNDQDIDEEFIRILPLLKSRFKKSKMFF